MDALGLFQTAGAVVAFLIGAFTLYDRTLRYRPLLSIATRLEGINARTYLRIKNVEPYDVFIESVSTEPRGFAVSTGHSVRAMVPVILGELATVVLEPGDDILLVIVRLDLEKAGLSEESPILVKAEWRRSQGRWFKPPAASLRTSLSDITARERAVTLTGQRV